MDILWDLTDAIWHIISVYRKEVETDLATSDWNSLSAKSFKSFDEPPEDAVIYLGSNGHKPLLDDLYNKIKQTNIKLKTEVQKITYADNAQVQLQLSDGTVMSADHVIVTPSLGYLKANAAKMFSPALPSDLTTAINGIGKILKSLWWRCEMCFKIFLLGYQSINKIFLIYTTPFWSTTFGKQYLYRVKSSPWNCTKSSAVRA